MPTHSATQCKPTAHPSKQARATSRSLPAADEFEDFDAVRGAQVALREGGFSDQLAVDFDGNQVRFQPELLDQVTDSSAGRGGDRFTIHDQIDALRRAGIGRTAHRFRLTSCLTSSFPRSL